MTFPTAPWIRALSLGLAIMVLVAGCSNTSTTATREVAEAEGTVGILVELNVPIQPEGFLTTSTVQSQRARIAAAQDLVVQALPATAVLSHTYQTIPLIALEADVATLDALSNHPNVRRIRIDETMTAFLDQSVSQIGADVALASHDLDGDGYAIAVIDTGVDVDHPMFAGKSTLEACFLNRASSDACPNGASTMFGAGAAEDRNSHGTHVASTAAGTSWSSPRGVIRGVAPEADILAVTVLDPAGSGSISDILKGLEWVALERNSLSSGAEVIAANLSLGGGAYSPGTCPTTWDAAFQNLLSVGITPIVASGNSGLTGMISEPSCSPYAVTVTATAGSGEDEELAYFANRSSEVDLAAPGTGIYAAFPTNRGSGNSISGTSMAAPHVAGAYALAAQAGFDDILGELQRLSEPVEGYDRIQLAELEPQPEVGTNLAFLGGLSLRTSGEGNFSVCARWSNVGPGDINTAFVQARGSWNGDVITDDDDLTVQGLAMGETFDDCFVLPGTLPLGSNTLTFVLDPEGDVDETDESDNSTSLSFNVVGPPSNDDLAEATALTGTSGSVTANNDRATREDDEPPHLDPEAIATLWWTWEAPTSGQVTFTTSGSDFDTVLAIYNEFAPGDLARVTYNDNISTSDRTSSVRFVTQANQQYWIAVGGYPWTQADANSGTGNIELSWELSDVNLTCDDVTEFHLREMGDVDKDGVVTEADALLALRMSEDPDLLAAADSDQLRHADVAQFPLDGPIDSSDVTKLLQKATDRSNLGTAIMMWPKILELRAGEVGCFLIGNAGGGEPDFDNVVVELADDTAEGIVIDPVDDFADLTTGRAVAVMIISDEAEVEEGVKLKFLGSEDFSYSIKRVE